MSVVLTNSEFFTYNNEVWVRLSDGTMKALKDSDRDVIAAILDCVSTFYPKAYAALSKEYEGCAPNQSYYRYRMAVRFIRCNFAALDDVPDFDKDMHCNFEYVNCPLRGECRNDHVICCPEFDHHLSRAELRVMALVYEGMTEDEIGEQLKLSPRTVHTHIYNANSRLGLHSKAEFIKYAAKNKLFS